MSVGFVRLMNATGQKLSLHYDGAAITFRPKGEAGSVLDLPKDAADFIRGHVGDQVIVLEGSKVMSLIERDPIETFYLANMSGNPDSPEYFEESFRNPVNGAPELKKIQNEMRQPQTFRARLGGFHGIKGPGSVRYRNEHGQMVLNSKELQITLPGKIVEIPPYGRIEVTREQAETLLRRDAERPEHQRGMLIRSRKPSAFEPDFNDPEWTIDKLRLYLEMVPASGDRAAGKDVMGPSEADIRAAAKDLTPTQLAIKLHEVRSDLWARCALRAADPAFTLPSERDFNLALARKNKAKQA